MTAIVRRPRRWHSIAVSIQNYLAIDIVIKNNIELIKGVDRASTTTVSALRTAVIVAQALNNQKLVLDQITALNVTTSNMIQSTSEMLRDNSVAIQQQAASATIGLPQLQAAFANIYETMDAIDAFIASGARNRKPKPMNLWRKLKIRKRIGYWGPA